jgi:hypothetical protein
MSLRACCRWLLVAVLLPLASCVSTSVSNLSSGAPTMTVDSVLIVYYPANFPKGFNPAGYLGDNMLAQLLPHLRSRLPQRLTEQGIPARMVTQDELPNIQRDADEKLMTITGSRSLLSYNGGDILWLDAEITDPPTGVSLWKGRIRLAKSGLGGQFDDRVADSIADQVLLQLRQARMMPRGTTPTVAATRALSREPTPRAVPQETPPPRAVPQEAPPPRIASGYAQLDDVDAIPYLSDRGRQVYRDWLALATPKAFAIAPNGSFFSTSGQRRDATLPVDATERALVACERLAKVPCKLYAVNGAVVWVK